MKIVYCPSTEINLQEYGIDIPLSASRRLQVVDHVVKKWGDKAIILENPRAYAPEDLALVHNEGYIDELINRPEKAVISTFELIDESGKPHRFDPSKATRQLSEMVALLLSHARGSYLAMERALLEGCCFYAGGGMHHAMSFGGRGFCLVNDIMLGLEILRLKGKVKNAWIIDVDAHKGDGTAELAEHKKWCHNLSVHMKHGWPLDRGSQNDPWFIPSKIDIEIEAGEEKKYCQRLEQGLNELFSREARPELAVVVLGADPWEGDELPSAGLLKLSDAQMLERDLLIHHFLRTRNIPAVYLMAGGYGPHSWRMYAQFLDQVLR